MKTQRILFATVPFDGHFSPLTGLAMHLRDLGHDVRWYVGGHYGDRVKKLGLPHYPTVMAPVINQENMDELFPERKKVKNAISRIRFDVEHTFLSPIPGYVQDIVQIHDEWQFDLIIYDLACLGALIAQELLCVKGVAVGVLPLFESETNRPTDDPNRNPLARMLTRWAKKAKMHFEFNIIMKPCNVRFNAFREQYGLAPEPGFMFEAVFRNSNLYLQSGVPGFDYPHRKLSPKVHYIGPLLPYKSGKKPAFAHAALTKQYKHVILATQGTFEWDFEKIIVPTLEAYKDATDTLVIVTTGGSGTETLRQRYPQSHFLIEDFIDYDAVMPYAHVYVTNGGYGGVMLALQHQLPIVVAGVHEGKNDIAARVQFNGVGIDLRTETPKAAQIRRAVTEVLSNDRYHQQVQLLSEEFNNYPTKDLATKYIESIFAEQPQLAAIA